MSDIPVQTADAVALRDNDRKLFAQYVTAERQKWRDRIRELAIETVGIAAHTGILSEGDVHKLMVIRAELKVRLNLGDNNDNKIILHISSIIKYISNYHRRLDAIRCFENEVSWLLKEDWERVKYETRPLWYWWHPLKKVDRENKVKSEEYEKSELLSWKTIRFFILSVVILLVIAAAATGAISGAYQLTQPDKKTNVEESSKASCNVSSAPLKISKSADFQILPNITISSVIINELNKDKENEILNAKFKKCMEK